MGPPLLTPNKIEVRLARSETEILAAQRLRYKVFYLEYKAIPSEEMERDQRDFDEFDAVTDHLIVIDHGIADARDQIVGTYRLLRQDIASRYGKFYTSGEYDIASLLNTGKNLLELGRSCVLADYRTRPVLQLLWEGITDYILNHQIGLMFGCASLHGTDIDALAPQLSYLYHYHLAEKDCRPDALPGQFVEMNIIPAAKINARQVFSELPPLIKGYLRLGARIGNGAVIDRQFNTTDVCIVMPTESLSERYVKHYSRKISSKAGLSDGIPARIGPQSVSLSELAEPLLQDIN